MLTSSSSVSTATPVSLPGQRPLARSVLAGLGALSLLLAAARIAEAQGSGAQAATWELRFTGGAFVPTGDQRNALKDAQVSAAQLAWVVRPSLAITGTVGWAQSRDLASANDPKLDVFTYDVGAEARAPELFAKRAVTFTPFAGVGAGARSYNYRKLDVDATHNVAAYGAVGGELGMGRVGLRLEVRDYTTGFKPLVGSGKADRRNDVVIMAGLRFNRRRAPVE